MSESFADLFADSLADTVMQPGSIIKGTIIDIRNDYVMVNVGLKSEGVIPVEQFYGEGSELEISVGDEVEVVLDAVEDGFGETRLSREKARRARAWSALEAASATDEIVKGTITGKVKGGFTVEMNDIRAFLPGSLVDIRPVRDTTFLEGRELEFKVIKLDQKRNNVVVSRRAVVESEFSEEREKLLENLKEGQQIKGVVKNLTEYGAFLDLGGIDGLLHITDMAWKRVKHPSEVVEVGQEIDVRILKFDRDRNRVSLGLKQLGDDPWTDVKRRYPDGARLFGKVTNIADYGCFIELEGGIEGLVHVSEMDWTNRNINPAKVVALGDEVEVMVLDIDENRRRISLGIKQCQQNPWEEFAQSHKKNDRVVGKIRSITDFGIFIGLEGGIDGLIHLSDLSWNDSGEDIARGYSKGDELEAVVLSVDPDRERISLSVKQLDRDPLGQYIADHPKGSIVSGEITEVNAKSAIVALGEGIEGVLRASELSLERVDDVRNELKEGDAVEAKFIGLDRKSRKIQLSIKAKNSDDEAEAINDYNQSSATPGTTLGDLMKEQMQK